MLSTPTKLTGGMRSVVYPNLAETNPDAKDAAFIEQYGQAHVSDYLSSGNPHWYNARDQYALRLSYAQGRQNTAQYRRMRKSNPKLDKLSVATDYRVLQIVPKYVKSVAGLLDEEDYIVSATPIDALARDKKRQFESRLRAAMENKALLAKLGIDMVDPGLEIPIDEDELQLKMMVNYKLKEAMELEMYLREGLYDCSYKQLARELDNAHMIFGASCVYAYRDDKHITPEQIEPWRCMFLPSRYEDHRDLRAGAHIDRISVGQLRKEAGDDLSEPMLNMIAAQAANWRNQSYGNSTSGGAQMALDSQLIEIIRFGFLSLNKRQSDGLMYWSWYEGNLIVGQPLSYGCREGFNQLRDMEDPRSCTPPYFPTIPDMVDGTSSCLIEQIIPVADFIQRNWVRLQDLLNRSVPSGYAFDLDRIEDVVLAEGKKLSKEEVIELFERTGRWVHNGVTQDGTKDGNIGLRQLVNGISADIEVLWNNILRGVELIERITGANSTISAGNPEARVAKGVSLLAKEGAVNALKFLFAAKQNVFERTCRVMALYYRNQAAATEGMNSGIAQHVFRIMISTKPTVEEWQDLYAHAKFALESGGISYGDYAFIVEVDNLKQARVMLAVRAKRKSLEDQQLAADNQKATFEGQVATAQQVEAAKQATIQMQIEMQNQGALQLLQFKEEAATQRAAQMAEIQAAVQRELQELRNQGILQNTALAGQWQIATDAADAENNPKPAPKAPARATATA